MKIFTKQLLLAAFLMIGVAAHAQTGTVTGKVLDSKEKQPIDYASVLIKPTKGDTSILTSAVTAPTGIFELKAIPPGTYKIYIGYLGYKSVNKIVTLTADKPTLNIGDILLENDGVALDGVDVKAEIPPMRVKKDTLEFNAAAFKVKENAVVEDVIKKLPGVDVDKDGKITAQGEEIKRVRVDGKDFMGNDPLLATRNLPADMIDKIQIIDDLSDQAKFSGVDDGNREKIINITTRQDKKNGYFGNSSVGYGTDDRYDANINVNKFKGNQQFSVIGQFNNVNKQNFGGGGGNFGGGGGMRMGFGGGGNFGGGGGGGITETNAFGFNFADTYEDGMQINGSYFFNKSATLNTSTSFNQNVFPGSLTTSNDNRRATTDRINHRLNFTIDTKLDTNTSIRMQPNLSFADVQTATSSVYDRSLFATTNTLTDGSQSYVTNTQTPSFSNNLLIRHKFQRRGRTLSLNVNTNINDSDAANFNKIDEITDRGGSILTRNLDQFLNNGTNSVSNNARLVFTEPLSKTLNLELNYNNGYSKSENDRLVYSYNPVTNLYDLIDPLYTNGFENTTMTHALGFSFNKTEKKYNWNIGVAVQNTDRDNLNLSNGFLRTQNFWNITPSAQYRYTFSQNKRLEIRYRGNTNQPSIDQILPIPDPTNPQVNQQGNPDLKPSFTNNINFNYRNFNFANFRNFIVFGNISQTFNAFASDNFLIKDGDSAGVTRAKTVNVDGNYNGFAGFNVGQPIVKGNKLTLNVGGTANLSRSKVFVDSRENIQKGLGLSGNLKLVSNMDKLDLTGGINYRWDHAEFSLDGYDPTNFYYFTPNIDISYLFPGNIRLQTDVYHNRVTGGGAAFNTSYTLWNAFISRQFFKNRGTFKISANDILNQNTGISRSVSANQISESNFNVLKRYYMFSFTYSLNRVGGRTMGGDQMRMPGMGGGRTMEIRN